MGNLIPWIIFTSFAIFFSFGAYLICADVLKLPTFGKSRAVINAYRNERSKTKQFEVVIFDIATKIGKLIKLDSYKKRRMEAMLKSVDIKLTPETYIATAWVRSFIILTCIIPTLLIIPILSPVIILISIIVYFKEIGRADEQLKSKREKIDYELPRFVSTIAQELKATRDVLGILIEYQKTAGNAFKNELEVTIADMKSGNQETALTRFESRIGSSHLSEVVRGIISVLRGDNGVVYFQMLAHDFKLLELQRLKMIAVKRPSKIRKYSLFMLGCFLLMYMVIIGTEIMNGLGKMF